jgi:hypothetical protein
MKDILQRIDEMLGPKRPLNEGAHDLYCSFPGNWTFSQVEKEWTKIQDEDRKEYGDNGYSGTTATFAKGLDFRSETFKSKAESRKFIQNNSEKWAKAIAVKTKDGSKDIWHVGGWAAE